MPAGSSDPRSTGEVVRGEAAGVGESVKEAGGHVARTAADQAREVAAETKEQARDLLHEGRHQVREQARAGQYKAADSLSSLAEELRQMAVSTDGSGLASDLAGQGAAKLADFAGWLQSREPGDLVEELRHWARQHPGTFLVGAALLGVAAGRLTRGAIAVQQDSDLATSPIRTSPTRDVPPSSVQAGEAYRTGELPYSAEPAAAGTGGYGTGSGQYGTGSTGYGTGSTAHGAGSTGYGTGSTGYGSEPTTYGSEPYPQESHAGEYGTEGRSYSSHQAERHEPYPNGGGSGRESRGQVQP
jgi:hypothetical protein